MYKKRNYYTVCFYHGSILRIAEKSYRKHIDCINKDTGVARVSSG